MSSLYGIPSVGILKQESIVPQGSPGIGTKPTSPFGENHGIGLSANYSGIKNQNFSLMKKSSFDVFSSNFRNIEILRVEAGRQNCFMCLIIFVIESLKSNIENSKNKKSINLGRNNETGIGLNEDDRGREKGSEDEILGRSISGINQNNTQYTGNFCLSPLMSDLCFEIFEIRNTNTLIDYLIGLGFNINDNRNDYN